VATVWTFAVLLYSCLSLTIHHCDFKKLRAIANSNERVSAVLKLSVLKLRVCKVTFKHQFLDVNILELMACLYRCSWLWYGLFDWFLFTHSFLIL